MNWVTTNIRFPEELYMELKMEAAKTRKSIAALVRESLAKKKITQKKDSAVMMNNLEKLAKETARQNKGINFTKGIIRMRYEK